MSHCWISIKPAALGGYVCQRRVHLGVALDAGLAEDRDDDLSEAVECLLGFPNADYAESALTLSRDVGKQPSTGQSAGDSKRVFPPVKLRTVSSYARTAPALILGDTRTIGICCSFVATATGYSGHRAQPGFLQRGAKGYE